MHIISMLRFRLFSLEAAFFKELVVGLTVEVKGRAVAMEEKIAGAVLTLILFLVQFGMTYR